MYAPCIFFSEGIEGTRLSSHSEKGPRVGRIHGAEMGNMAMVFYGVTGMVETKLESWNTMIQPLFCLGGTIMPIDFFPQAVH